MITVVGQGYVGLPISIAAAEAGYTVNGFDIDAEKILNLQQGITESPDINSNRLLELQLLGKIKFSSNILDQSQSSIFIIAVPTPLDMNYKPDLRFLETACTSIAQVVKAGSLIINESTSFIGTLRNFIMPIIKNISNLEDLDFVVAPERIDPGNFDWHLKNTPRVIGGINQKAVEKAKAFYDKICDNVSIVSAPEVAEAAKLFENTFRQVNIALVNEFAEIAAEFGFSSHEAIKAAATKPFGFMPFYPSIGTGGHCIPVDPSYLVHSGDAVGVPTKLIGTANTINRSRPLTTAERIKNFLGGDINDKYLQVAGIAYKPNISDLRESPAVELLDALEKYGARVAWSDPYVKVLNGRKSIPLDPSVDLGLIVTPHSNFDFTIWKQSQTKVLDLSSNPKNFGWPKFF